jgi:hypothetical protein
VPILMLALCFAAAPRLAAQASGTVERGDFRFVWDEGGVSGLAHPRDPYGAVLVPAARPGGAGGAGGAGDPAAGGAVWGTGTLSLGISYRVGEGEWVRHPPRGGAVEVVPEDGSVTYITPAGQPLQVTETFRTDGAVLDWTVAAWSTGTAPVTIGDFSFHLPVQGPQGQDARAIFERGFLRHHFVSGDGSFFFFTRASGAPPFLIATALPGTRLEYFAGGGRGGGPVFVHSYRSGNEVENATWRQAHTALTLAPGDTARYGFRFQWANSYDEMRDVLHREGLFDIRVVPGMSLPTDLTARFALRTLARVDSIRPEHPEHTTLRYLGDAGRDTYIWEVAFRRLGENLLTIHHDGDRATILEFFATEPLETLIQKRARFIVDRTQVRDTAAWWNGVFGPYDARAGVTRTLDDPDIFLGRMIYVLTCDDPGLAKPPFLAAKNVAYPDRREIEALEYYIENFLWGGMQRTDTERPYPYGVYGTPHWYINRSPERRAAYTDRDLDREHVWRSYDYPHVIMLYYHMYEIAKMYPELSTYLDATGYLERAYHTARAFYIYPYEIYPDYYETYKWGLYNELVVLKLIDALEREGYPTHADWLRAEWEKKVKYFVYDDEYPLRSEYAFDRTAFESSHALAKYGATHDMRAADHLWWDVQEQKWYSHPLVRREDSRAFMDRQIAGNLVVRGWLNPSYYQLGADGGLSYMAAMGGWGVLDYGLNFAPDPFPWLQLGYASYLSSWSLMNTGTAETDYGYWYPGEENDGAAGWQFMSAKRGSAWMGSSWPGGVQVPRGPWHYDGEIDLGFGGALRMARTVLVQDPVFGWFAYGGVLTKDGDTLHIEPRDGLRKRFDVVLPDHRAPSMRAERLALELSRDGFASGEPILVGRNLGRVAFTLENRTGTMHRTELALALPYGARYTLEQDGRPVTLTPTGDREYPWRAELAVSGASSRVVLNRVDVSGR